LKAPIRFIDASVFVHAYLKPKRALKPFEVQIKEAAKKIVARVNRGEQVLTTVVHFCEISNILEDYLPLDEAFSVERALCMRENVEVVSVAREDCIAALDEAENHRLGLSDALGYVVMKNSGVNELYSFDRDFDRLTDVKRLQT